jgi:putative hydrolase of the HAD superfamily
VASAHNGRLNRTGKEELAMAFRAVVFDIGGVLEFTPPLDIMQKWADRLGLGRGELPERLGAVFAAGNVGALTEAEIHTRIGQILALGRDLVDAFMADIWTEYLGTLNTELTAYFAGLRPAHRTGIISNSFVGAREREQERYGFEQLTDDIVYSHEVGICKPDQRIYELACARLGVLPSEMIFLDDKEPNVEAARDLGARGVLFASTAQAIAEIEACLHPATPS